MLAIKEIVELSKGKLLNGDENIKLKSYEFDSRLVIKGNFFIPIKGEKTDGHKYIIECVRKGIIGFLIFDNLENKQDIVKESIDINKKIIIIEVKDTQKTFFDMGKRNREKHINTPIVAITGSVGKTSTREIISSVLEVKYNVLKTEKNYNSYIGVPYMLLKIDKQDICVIEIGIDKIGEMDQIASVVRPDVAVITNIGLSHIENFGSIDVTYKEKIKLCNNLKQGGICFINGDDSMLSKVQNDYKGTIIKYGMQNDEQYILKNINHEESKITFDVEDGKINKTVEIKDIGNHNILNAMAAIKVGKFFNINIEESIQGISKYRNFDKRMKKENLKNECAVINDAYNASYDSILSGLKTLEQLRYSKKIIVIGDILELGGYSKEVHVKIGQKIKEFKVDVVITYGAASKYIYNELKDSNITIYEAREKETILDIIDKEIVKNTLIYVKASNGMKLYEISDRLAEKYR